MYSDYPVKTFRKGSIVAYSNAPGNTFKIVAKYNTNFGFPRYDLKCVASCYDAIEDVPVGTILRFCRDKDVVTKSDEDFEYFISATKLESLGIDS